MIFEVKNGYYGYEKGKNLFEDINLKINDGEVLTILGANGVGKTTLLKCMMGIFKWHKGETLIDNKNIKDIPYQEIWKQIGYVPQAKNSAFAYTAEEMVLLGRSPHLSLFKQPKKEDLEVVEEAMSIVGINYLKNKYCNQMSGGELQMVLIARALASKPKMLVMDEPESNLDFKNQLIILETIEKLSSEYKISCIINTHYPEHALRVGNKALILCKDYSKFYGDARKVINRENMKKAFGVEVAIENIEVESKDFTYVFPIKFVTDEPCA